jgi:hypothetical protein
LYGVTACANELSDGVTGVATGKIRVADAGASGLLCGVAACASELLVGVNACASEWFSPATLKCVRFSNDSITLKTGRRSPRRFRARR